MSERSYLGYKRLGCIATSMIHRISLVLARSQRGLERFTDLEAPLVETIGSLKFDGIHKNDTMQKLNTSERLLASKEMTLFLLQAAHRTQEESLAVETFLEQQKTHPYLKLILVPRHVERTGEIANWLNVRLQQPDASHVVWHTRSTLKSDTNQLSDKSFILLVDVTGELAAWWGLATVAFVGGSLDGLRRPKHARTCCIWGCCLFRPLHKELPHRSIRTTQSRSCCCCS